MSPSGGPPVHWHPVKIGWLPPQLGGRPAPPPGPNYAPTARLEDEPLSEAFSVMFRLRPGGSAESQPADMALLFPENFGDKIARLTPGACLVVLEGRREVAHATVVGQGQLVLATA